MNTFSLSSENYTWKNALLWGNCWEHCKKAREGKHRYVHLAIAVIEFLPVISQITSIFEKIIALHFKKKFEDSFVELSSIKIEVFGNPTEISEEDMLISPLPLKSTSLPIIKKTITLPLEIKPLDPNDESNYFEDKSIKLPIYSDFDRDVSAELSTPHFEISADTDFDPIDCPNRSFFPKKPIEKKENDTRFEELKENELDEFIAIAPEPEPELLNSTGFEKLDPTNQEISADLLVSSEFDKLITLKQLTPEQEQEMSQEMKESGVVGFRGLQAKGGLRWEALGKEKTAFSSLKNSLEDKREGSVFIPQNYEDPTDPTKKILLAPGFWKDLDRDNVFFLNLVPLFDQGESKIVKRIKAIDQFNKNLTPNEIAGLTALVHQGLFTDFLEYIVLDSGFEVVFGTEQTLKSRYYIDKLTPKNGTKEKTQFKVICEKECILVNHNLAFNARVNEESQSDVGYISVRREMLISEETLNKMKIEEGTPLGSILDGAIINDYISPVCLTPEEALENLNELGKSSLKKTIRSISQLTRSWKSLYKRTQFG